MGRKKKKLPLLEQVQVIDIGAEGKAVARVDEQVLFISYCVPGDVIDVQLTKKRRKFLEGVPVKFHQYSDERSTPFCEHFGTCGGCKWQQLPYDRQLYYKQKQVVDQMQRIGGFGEDALGKILPVLGSEKTDHYRNKLEFTFSNKRWLTTTELESKEEIEEHDALGFHIPGLYDKVLDVKNCYLQPEPSNTIRNWFRKNTRDRQLSYFDIRKHQGLLRNLIVRTAGTGETMVIVSFYDDSRSEREQLLKEFSEAFPDVTSLMYVVNQKPNDTILDQEVILFYGRDFISERMEELEFRIGPKSFYQTNPAQAYKLYKVVREFAALTGNEKVWDLYTGTGTIANFLAPLASHILGIESIPEAIGDARKNAKLNKILNTGFIVSDIRDLNVKELISDFGTPGVIILDPPRAGVHQNVINHILEAAPGRIVYVSCNPATQARDLALLGEAYRIEKMQPLDMFPQTQHVENVVLLKCQR